MPSMAWNQTASQREAISAASRPSRWARAMILSSMSVMFDTRRTPQARPLEVAAEDVVGERRPAVAQVGRAVDGGSAQVDVHLTGLAQRQLADLAGGRVVQAEHPGSVGGTRPANRRRFAGRAMSRRNRSSGSRRCFVLNASGHRRRPPGAPTRRDPTMKQSRAKRTWSDWASRPRWPSTAGTATTAVPGVRRHRDRPPPWPRSRSSTASPTCPVDIYVNGGAPVEDVVFTTVATVPGQKGVNNVEIRPANAPARSAPVLARSFYLRENQSKSVVAHLSGIRQAEDHGLRQRPVAAGRRYGPGDRAAHRRRPGRRHRGRQLPDAVRRPAQPPPGQGRRPGRHLPGRRPRRRHLARAVLDDAPVDLAAGTNTIVYAIGDLAGGSFTVAAQVLLRPSVLSRAHPEARPFDWPGLRRARVPSWTHVHRSRPAHARRHRRPLGPALGRGRHLPLRPLGPPLRGLLDRHPAAHGVGVAPHRARVQLHPHGHRRPLPPHARPTGLLPHGLGRQRPAHRAAGADLLRRPLRPVAPVRPRVRAARDPRQAADPRRPPQLRGAVRAAHGRRRAGLRGRVAPPRAVGGLAPLLHDHRRAVPADQPGRLPAQPGARRGLPAGGADALGRRRPHRRGPGRDGGPGDPRRLPPARLPPHRRQRGRGHRHQPSRAGGVVRGPRGPPRRRPLPARCIGEHGHHAAVRRRGPGRRPRAGRSREGHRRSP